MTLMVKYFYNETVGTAIFICCPFGEQLNIIGLLVGPSESEKCPIALTQRNPNLYFAKNGGGARFSYFTKMRIFLIFFC
jgi:hypothetical protein